MIPESWSLQDKVAIVTGGARGIGLAAATLLRARGARLVISDRSTAVASMEASDIATLVGDVSEEDTALRTVRLALERFGKLDILVNNAGRTMNKSLLDTTRDDWDAVMAVNAGGYFLHSREAVRAMLNGEGGTIVNVASIVSIVAMKDTAAYAASKGAIAQLTKVTAVDYGIRGIRANAIAAGVVETDILQGIVDDSRSTLASYGDSMPIGRVAQATEIAELIGFLAIPASSFMTGSVVVADGGYTAI